MSDHPWASAYLEFKELLPGLQAEGKKIGEKAMAGDETCQKIIHHYALLHKSFDPMTLIFLKEHFNKYMASIKGTEG